MQKTIAGKTVEVNESGYMTNPNEWEHSIAEEIALEMGVTLTDNHYGVIDYLRKENVAESTMSIRKIRKSGIVSIEELYDLFPGGALKNASKIAGLTKPKSCI